jgi:hypothetical protein
VLFLDIELEVDGAGAGGRYAELHGVLSGSCGMKEHWVWGLRHRVIYAIVRCFRLDVSVGLMLEISTYRGSRPELARKDSQTCVLQCQYPHHFFDEELDLCIPISRI